MTRLKFNLNSDQLELLMAFENAQGLSHLAELMAKDPSVISRNLQRIAEDYPVLTKVKGRWELTPLGIQINAQTRSYLSTHSSLLAPATNSRPQESLLNTNSVLIIINAQNGLLDATQEGRNNSDAERNIHKILGIWRAKNRRVLHVKHASENPNSSFYRNSTGYEILKALAPDKNEDVIEKTKSSAFADTNLEELLTKQTCSNIILVGFTANECIDSTARDSAAKGFDTIVVGDATATFDLQDPAGKMVKAERVHKLTLANINAFYAKVVNTKDLIS